MKKIAVISTAPTQFKSLLQYAFILRENFEVVFYFDDSQDAILNETELADKHGFRYYFHIGSPHFKEFAGKEARDGFRMPLQTRMLKRLFPGSAIVQALCNNHYHEHHAKVFMEFYKPDIILSAQDNFGITPVFVKLAKKTPVKTVVSVFTLANQEELGYVFSKLKEYMIKTPGQKIAFALYPRWKMIYRGIRTACETPARAVAKEWTGHAPKNPWISVGGRSDYAIMESDFTKEYYRRSGLLANKIRLVAHPALQRFREMLDKKEDYIQSLKSKYNRISNLPVVLCTLPPDHFPNSTFRSHEEIVRYWLSVLTMQQTHQVWISLHPRQKAADVACLSEYNAIVVQEPIEELIPLCDLFVAQYSATIRMALMCRKSVLNYDMFDAGYTEYQSCPGVATVHSRQEFEDHYKALCAQSLGSGESRERAVYYGDFTSEPAKNIISFFESA